MPNLGRIESVGLREVWPDEARDFTPWLASEEGMELLSEKLGIDLELVNIERQVGPFRVDIVARVPEDDAEVYVVAENVAHAAFEVEQVLWLAGNLNDDQIQAEEPVQGVAANIVWNFE